MHRSVTFWSPYRCTQQAGTLNRTVHVRNLVICVDDFYLVNTHMHARIHSYTHPFSSRTPRVHSTWQPTGVTYLSSSISVQCLETEYLTGMEMMKRVWTLLAGWDRNQLQTFSHRTTHSWRQRWVWSRDRHNEIWLQFHYSVIFL